MEPRGTTVIVNLTGKVWLTLKVSRKLTGCSAAAACGLARRLRVLYESIAGATPELHVHYAPATIRPILIILPRLPLKLLE
jgi:hypothetical protein